MVLYHLPLSQLGGAPAPSGTSHLSPPTSAALGATLSPKPVSKPDTRAFTMVQMEPAPLLALKRPVVPVSLYSGMSSICCFHIGTFSLKPGYLLLGQRLVTANHRSRAALESPHPAFFVAAT